MEDVKWTGEPIVRGKRCHEARSVRSSDTLKRPTNSFPLPDCVTGAVRG